MKLLVLDIEGEGTGVDIAYLAQNHDHDVRYWLPDTRGGNRRPYGDGLLQKPKEWQSSMDWADLIIVTGNNKYTDDLAPYFGKGYPLFASNAKSAELELDRGKGQELLKTYGVETSPYRVVSSLDEAIAHVAKTGKGYAVKPWGGHSDSSMTFVAKDANEALFTLQRWKDLDIGGGKLMLQELVEGVEIGISGWFGPQGWLSAIEESFEHKKFLTGDLGENTGEMGTVIRHVKSSKLFDMVLDPLGEYLQHCNYVGDCAVNCIIEANGTVHPLEFTMRLGWPDFVIRQEVIQSDPIEWILDLLYGRDSLKVSDKIACGVVITHGDFPKCKDPPNTWSGFPVKGLTSANSSHIHLQQVMLDSVPILQNSKVRMLETLVTAGTYPLVVTGAGASVTAAMSKAYQTVKEISFPSNMMYRTDIGKRLKKDLSAIQKHGFAKGMNYD